MIIATIIRIIIIIIIIIIISYNYNETPFAFFHVVPG